MNVFYILLAGIINNKIRLDKYLINIIKIYTRNKIQKLIKNGFIQINQKKINKNYYIKSYDLIFFLKNKIIKKYNYNNNYYYNNNIFPEKIYLNIIYEDTDIIVVNKQPGLIVHPCDTIKKGTLINALEYYFNKKNFKNKIFYNIVHRIDKDTSGLIIISKNKKSFISLKKQFFLRKIKKKYLAIVWGDLKNNSGIIENYIIRDSNNRKRMMVSSNNKGKYSLTYYYVIKRFYYFSLINCFIKTGRKHQIRVHMKHIGHPIFNDNLYGGNKILKGNINSYFYKKIILNCFKILNRQALHAQSIEFFHPYKKKYICFNTHIPNDIKNFLKILNKIKF